MYLCRSISFVQIDCIGYIHEHESRFRWLLQCDVLVETSREIYAKTFPLRLLLPRSCDYPSTFLSILIILAAFQSPLMKIFLNKGEERKTGGKVNDRGNITEK